MNKNNKSQDSEKVIALNRKASHDYFLEQHYEAGLILQGWEVKSLRAGRAQLKESYVLIKQGEAWLFHAHFSPLLTASTHINPEPTRSRKLLLHQKELNRLIGATQRQGYTVIPLKLYWKNNRVKLAIALAKGKKDYDKRESLKQKEWEREKHRVLKRGATRGL